MTSTLMSSFELKLVTCLTYTLIPIFRVSALYRELMYQFRQSNELPEWMMRRAVHTLPEGLFLLLKFGFALSVI